MPGNRMRAKKTTTHKSITSTKTTLSNRLSSLVGRATKRMSRLVVFGRTPRSPSGCDAKTEAKDHADNAASNDAGERHQECAQNAMTPNACLQRRAACGASDARRCWASFQSLPYKDALNSFSLYTRESEFESHT